MTISIPGSLNIWVSWSFAKPAGRYRSASPLCSITLAQLRSPCVNPILSQASCRYPNTCKRKSPIWQEALQTACTNEAWLQLQCNLMLYIRTKPTKFGWKSFSKGMHGLVRDYAFGKRHQPTFQLLQLWLCASSSEVCTCSWNYGSLSWSVVFWSIAGWVDHQSFRATDAAPQ